MSQASLREGAAGELQLAGVLDYSSGPALREQGGRLIRASQAAELVVDCSAVERSRPTTPTARCPPRPGTNRAPPASARHGS